MVKTFHLKGELEDMERLLNEDVYNNSAWNHRYYYFTEAENVSPQDFEKELDFTIQKIQFAPYNESPWNYLKG